MKNQIKEALFIVSAFTGTLLFLSFSSYLSHPKPVEYVFRESTLRVVEEPLVELAVSEVKSKPIKFAAQQEIVASQIANQIVGMVNQYRIQKGSGSLKANSILVDTAKEKGLYLIEHDKFEHYPDGISLDYWFAKYFDSQPPEEYSGAGENLAAGFWTARQVVDAWIKSPRHEKNMVNPNYSEIGVFVGTTKSKELKRDGRMLVVLHLGGIFKQI